MAVNESRVYPRIFEEFEGPTKDGKPPRKYWIQDATEDMFDEIIEHFVTGFMKDEPVSKYMNGQSDEKSLEETRVMHKLLLNGKMSLVCLTKNEAGETKLAGFNVLSISTPDEKISDIKFDGWFSNFIVQLFTYLDAQRSVFKELGVDRCLKAMGLYVLPDYRGEGLGVHILKARVPLCQSMGIKVTSTVFTSIVSQKQAYKASFQDWYAVDYDALAKDKPEFHIPNIQEHTKTIKVLYKLIE